MLSATSASFASLKEFKSHVTSLLQSSKSWFGKMASEIKKPDECASKPSHENANKLSSQAVEVSFLFSGVLSLQVSSESESCTIEIQPETQYMLERVAALQVEREELQAKIFKAHSNALAVSRSPQVAAKVAEAKSKVEEQAMLSQQVELALAKVESDRQKKEDLINKITIANEAAKQALAKISRIETENKECEIHISTIKKVMPELKCHRDRVLKVQNEALSNLSKAKTNRDQVMISFVIKQYTFKEIELQVPLYFRIKLLCFLKDEAAHQINAFTGEIYKHLGAIAGVQYTQDHQNYYQVADKRPPLNSFKQLAAGKFVQLVQLIAIKNVVSKRKITSENSSNKRNHLTELVKKIKQEIDLFELSTLVIREVRTAFTQFSQFYQNELHQISERQKTVQAVYTVSCPTFGKFIDTNHCSIIQSETLRIEHVLTAVANI